MYLPLSWLKEFVKYRETTEKVADIFTMGGFEVEKVIQFGKGLEKIIVGEIKTITSHSGADKLSVCKVDVGRKQLLNIVCGAPNVKAGQKVPCALVDTVLPSGMKIERRRIRGVDSEGMLCAEDELGLGDDHEGIMILDESLRAGRKFIEAVKLSETVLDITLSPNRPDCYSIIGLAYEYAALSGQNFTDKKVTVTETGKETTKSLLNVTVKENALCPKYTARIVRNIKVGPSPLWLQSRLRVSGVKPVNNIVDITNYVMLEYGQPLHAFDYANVDGKKIIIRKADTETSFMTLDGEKRKLTPDMLMIADGSQSIAVAGVMGGENSEITDKTTDIVIESAIFDPLSIRKTRQQLGLVTEASTRFEKGIYWDLPDLASNRAADLMAELAGGEVTKGMIVVSKDAKRTPSAISVESDYISGLIGKKFTTKDIVNAVERLGFEVKASGANKISVVPPSWRQDIAIPADIAEEVGRMFGWNKLKPAPVYAVLNPTDTNTTGYWTRIIKDTLVAGGMTEMLNYSFYGRSLITQLEMDITKHYQVENPLNPEQAYMRTSLIPRLLDNVLKNYQNRDAISLFETGNVFFKTQSGMPDERTFAAGILLDKRLKRNQLAQVQKLKGIVSVLIDSVGVPDDVQYKTKDDATVVVMVRGEQIGYVRWLYAGTQKIGMAPVCFEIDIQKLLKNAERHEQYVPVSEFPTVERDITFRTPPEVPYSAIISMIEKVDPLIVAVNGTELYQESDKNVNTTFRIVFQLSDRTLTSQEVDAVEHKIIETAAKKLNMKIKK